MLSVECDTNECGERQDDHGEKEQTTDDIADRPGFSCSDRECVHARGRIARRGRQPLAQITCSNCGEVFEDQEFCPNCGQWVGPIPGGGYEEFELGDQTPEEEPLPPRTPVQRETVSCPSCGAPNPSTNRHCEQCGARLSQGPLPVAPRPIIRTTAGARALVVILGTVAIVLILAFIVNSLRGANEPTAESTTTTETTVAVADPVEIVPISYTCSSELNDAYSCAALFDGNKTTYWNDASAKGKDAEITMTFAEPYRISQLIVTNVQDDTKFQMNYKIKGYEIILNDDPSSPIVGTLENKNAAQVIPIDSLATSQITFKVTSVYPSLSVDNQTPFNELALAELTAWGRPAN
jgi:hypothetical protein